MTIDDTIKDEKLQCNINRKAAKLSENHQVKLIYINFLQAKIYGHLIKVE